MTRQPGNGQQEMSHPRLGQQEGEEMLVSASELEDSTAAPAAAASWEDWNNRGVQWLEYGHLREALLCFRNALQETVREIRQIEEFSQSSPPPAPPSSSNSNCCSLVPPPPPTSPSRQAQSSDTTTRPHDDLQWIFDKAIPITSSNRNDVGHRMSLQQQRQHQEERYAVGSAIVIFNMAIVYHIRASEQESQQQEEQGLQQHRQVDQQRQRRGRYHCLAQCQQLYKQSWALLSRYSRLFYVPLGIGLNNMGMLMK